MACGYVCTNCGKCRSEQRILLKPGACLSCGFENDPNAAVCISCGQPLLQPPGQRQAASAAMLSALSSAAR